MSEKLKSLAIIKKGSIKLADILVGTGIAIQAGPAGKLTYEISKLLVGYAQEFIKERNDERLNHFHRTLITGDLEEEEVKEFLEKDIDLEEYYTLLRAAIQDDEDQKTYYYAELLRKLALGQVPIEYKLYLMKIVKELTSFEIDLIRKIYIYKKFDLIPNHGPSEQVSSLFSNKSLEMKLATDNLVRVGLLEREKQELKPTNIMVSAANIFFKSNDLTPASINREIWRSEHVLVVAPQGDKYLAFSEKIQLLLRDNRFKPGPILLFHSEFSRKFSLMNISILILIGGRTMHGGFSSLEEMDDLAKTIQIPPSVKVIKVIVKIDDLPFDNFLPSVQADKVVNCSLSNIHPLSEVIKNLGDSE